VIQQIGYEMPEGRREEHLCAPHRMELFRALARLHLQWTSESSDRTCQVCDPQPTLELPASEHA
jgi:hypothetical protein